ncbi:type I glyceraldehyde-3-phosphate dehydrogenase [Anaerovorax sp. IOR16]|uniref:type I glyceraldehyde-3-phosphate dehydrogenase n=1 Tax=Anaerovorax sp. IOR16 TaxID=2773458 RepID=UPI0019D089CE|nr:type I glyceraldehyde-3-phosphate dehydrogenase [Anaerovorax sp. IOR16]
MKTKVGINGFGRIGRNAFKIAQDKNVDYEIVAINDLTTPSTLAHLLKYDSCFGKFHGTVEATEDSMIVNGKEIKVYAEKDPENIPWKELGVEVVLEATGIFTKRAGAEKHIKAGVKKVVISAPATDEDITIVMGVNEEKYDPTEHHIISNASCTTNCLAPFAKVIDKEFEIKKGLMTTVHSYTNDQRILDLPHRDLRRSRAACLSMIPTTTGAARAVSLVLPQLAGKLNGMALRVPTPAVSVVDIVIELGRSTDVKEVNAVLKSAAENELKGILGFCEESLVSIDFKQDDRSSIIDSQATMMLGDNMVKILSWYDNEWGYSNRVVDLIQYVITKGL